MTSHPSNPAGKEPVVSPKVAHAPEFDQRMIETIDFSDPKELAKMLAATDDESEPKDGSQ